MATEQKKRFGYFSLSLIIIFSVLFGMVLAGSIGRTPPATATEGSSPATPGEADDGSMPVVQVPSFADIAERINPAVVNVISTDIIKSRRLRIGNCPADVFDTMDAAEKIQFCLSKGLGADRQAVDSEIF